MYRDALEVQAQRKSCFMFLTTTQLARCFQVVYQKKYQERRREADTLPRAQKKDILAALQASQVLTDLSKERLDVTFRPYKIFNRRGRVCVVQEDQDCTILNLDYQLEFLPAKGDCLFPLFRAAETDSAEQKIVKDVIRWFVQSYESSTNLLMANNSQFRKLTEELSAQFPDALNASGSLPNQIV